MTVVLLKSGGRNPSIQCAAVTTCVSEIKAPRQRTT